MNCGRTVKTGQGQVYGGLKILDGGEVRLSTTG
jgi:hypothetical protein